MTIYFLWKTTLFWPPSPSDPENVVSLWPHQQHDIDAFHAAVAEGHRRILLTRPTGMGKSRVLTELLWSYVARGRRAILYSNRRLLIDQLCRDMDAHGINYGIRAAGHAPRDALLQIASIQTEQSRTLRTPKRLKKLKDQLDAGDLEPDAYFREVAAVERKAMDLYPAELVVIDEVHQMATGAAVEIMAMHCAAEAVILGVTATPINLGRLFDHLIGAGNVSEGRACGSLVPCVHYAPDEPDLAGFRAVAGEDLSEKDAEKLMLRKGLFGRVLENYHLYNPEHAPTILFGPSVQGSIYFAEEFTKAGIAAAHIDGQDIWLNGELHRSDPDLRQYVLDATRTGEIEVLCNRFVLREGINLPHIRHMILATRFGALQSYLQAGGRGLRACPGKECLTVQDHGGNYLLHGSLNSDRDWSLGITSSEISGLRQERMRRGLEAEPFLCPQCRRVWIRGTVCSCGYKLDRTKRSRIVVQSDGTLKEVSGTAIPPRRYADPSLEQRWERIYWAAKKGKSGLTFRQAIGWFVQDTKGRWPMDHWKFMPRDLTDYVKRVRDVPPERLHEGTSHANH